MQNENQPGMNKFLGTVSSDFIKVSKRLQEASYEMIQRKFKYPIFILSKDHLKSIPLIFGKNDMDNIWFYHGAYLKMLIENKFIDKAKEEHFKENYKNPEEYCCLLILDPQFSGIIFMPYPEEY